MQDHMATSYFQSHWLLNSQPGKQIDAIMAWRDAVSKKIDEYARSSPPKDPSTLFQLKTPDSMVGDEKWAPYVSAALGANTMGKDAAAVAAGTKAPIAGPPPSAVATPAPGTKLTTPEEVKAWIDTLPPNVTHISIPGRGIAPIPGRTPGGTVAATTEPGSAVVAPAAMTPTGKVVPAAPAKPKGETPEFGGSINDVSPEYAAKHVTEIDLGALGYAVKTAYATLNPIALLRNLAETRFAAIEALENLPTAARRESARAYFEDIMKKDRFFKEDVPAIREALKYGDLSTADRKRAKAMLKAAGEKE